MKKIIFTLALFVGLTALAQVGKQMKGYMADMTPEQMATLRTKKMTLALDLTNAQQTKVYDLNLENTALRITKMEERKAMKQNGEASKPTSEERFAMQNERLDRQIAHKATMKGILSPEQYEKWEKMQQHRKRMHHKGKGGKNRGNR